MATLQEVMEPYTHIRLATKDDNEAILEFYKDIHMETGEESLSFDRGANFFKFYERKGNKYWTFLFLNDDKSICGVGTIIRQLRFVDGAIRPVAYFCDLRVAANGGRRAKVQWRKLFSEVIELLPNLPEEDRCEMAYTAILSDNQAAINSLTKGGRGFNYRHIDNYHVYSVVSPPLFNPSRAKVRQISFNDFIEFYKNESRHLELAEDLTNDPMTHYFGIYDNSELAAVFAYTDADFGRSYKMYNLKTQKKLLTQLIESTGKPKVENGHIKSLEIQFLTFKTASSEDTKKELITGMLKYLKQNNILKKYHICNLYTGQDEIDFDFLIDGIVVKNTGHMFEIHTSKNNGLWPIKPFRFEGSLL